MASCTIDSLRDLSLLQGLSDHSSSAALQLGQFDSLLATCLQVHWISDASRVRRRSANRSDSRKLRFGIMSPADTLISPASNAHVPAAVGCILASDGRRFPDTACGSYRALRHEKFIVVPASPLAAENSLPLAPPGSVGSLADSYAPLRGQSQGLISSVPKSLSRGRKVGTDGRF